MEEKSVCTASCTLFGLDAGEYAAGREYPAELAERYPRHFRRVAAEIPERAEENPETVKKLRRRE